MIEALLLDFRMIFIHVSIFALFVEECNAPTCDKSLILRSTRDQLLPAFAMECGSALWRGRRERSNGEVRLREGHTTLMAGVPCSYIRSTRLQVAILPWVCYISQMELELAPASSMIGLSELELHKVGVVSRPILWVLGLGDVGVHPKSSHKSSFRGMPTKHFLQVQHADGG